MTNQGASSGSKADDEVVVDDPFAMLQELISDGSLIKEAVRRLQKGLFVANAKTFYDSEDDDECGRTPPNQYTDLCCEVGI